MTCKQLINRLRWMIFVDSREYLNKYLGPIRRKSLRGGVFTIISNNCWAAHVYRRYQLEYNTPTVGLYFFPTEYLKFLSNLEYYVQKEMSFIPAKESKYYSRLIELGQQNKLIGKLDDVEIVLLHYKTEDEAREKWKRRVERINWDRLLIKCTKQNGMTDEQVKEFDKLPFNHKMIFVPYQMPAISSAVVYKSDIRENQVWDDIIHFNRYINLTKWINSCY